MVTIKGKKYLTITAVANETYKIVYGNSVRISMLNMTGGDILICESPNPSSGAYFTLPPSIGLNEVSIRTDGVNTINGIIYIKAGSAGKVSIVRCSD